MEPDNHKEPRERPLIMSIFRFLLFFALGTIVVVLLLAGVCFATFSFH